jgi:hypothetical protein
LERIRQVLFGHPLVKAISLGLFGILGNVLAGAYVFEITKQGATGQFIGWWASPHSRSFWLLVGVLLLMGLYGWGMTRFETRARKAATEADVLGIALEKLLGPMIEVAKKDIKEGRIRSLDDVKKMFGPRGGQR